LSKPTEAKNIFEIFCEAFLILRHPILFSVFKNGSFFTPEVRIRMKERIYSQNYKNLVKNCCGNPA
jgi:hypothetical protein